MTPPLACPVRDCGLALTRGAAAWTCPRGHAFDLARSGYVNLVQPQDRRSAAPGDSRASVEARRRLHDAGVGRVILDAFVRRAAALLPPADAVVVDLGCGAGDALGALAATIPIQGIGIDLSAAAVTLAARRFPDLTWVVANADRRLPLLDASASLVLSLHARRHAAECARVLAAGGHLLVAVPAADDLLELRELVLGSGVERQRGPGLLAEMEGHFTLIARERVGERPRLARESLLDLLQGTYRGARSSAAERVAALEELDVTIASEIFLFRAR